MRWGSQIHSHMHTKPTKMIELKMNEQNKSQVK